MRSPMLALACSFALGIFLAHGTASGWWRLLGLSGACLLIGLVAFAHGRMRVAAVLALAGFVFAGAANARLFAHRFSSSDVSHLCQWGFEPGTALQMEGSLLTNPLRTPSGLQFDFGVSEVALGNGIRRAAGKILLRVPNAGALAASGLPENLREGDLIRVRAKLRRPSRYRNPGDFDFRRWSESIQDVTWQGSVEGRNSLDLLRRARPSWFRGFFGRVRQRLLAGIDQLYPPWSVEGRDGAVLKAVLLGDRSALDSATVEDFRRSGLYHLLVVAGLHVGLLVMLAGILFRMVGFREVWRSILLLFFLAFYAGLVEERASTLRASLMIAAYLTARLLDRQQAALNAVGVAALILLLRRPAWLFDSGFQLSFAAALLIAGLAVPLIERLTEPYRRGLAHLQDVSWDTSFEPRAAQFRLEVRSVADWLGARWGVLSAHPEGTLRSVALPLRTCLWLAELAIFSAVLQLGLMLPMAEIFHRITLAGIGLNTLAVPLMTLLLAIAVPTVLLSVALPPAAVLPSKVLDVMMRGLFALTNLPRFPSWLSFRVPVPPDWVAWGFALSVIAVAVAPWRRSSAVRFLTFAAASFGLLIAWHPFVARIPGGVLQVTGLDCGGGESLLAVLPDRSTVLVGAGGGGRGSSGSDPIKTARWDPGGNIVSPYLWSKGISSLDVLVVPGSRGSSLLGVASVLRNFRVKELWSVPLPPAFAAPLFSLARDRGVRLRQLTTGDLIKYHGFSFRVFWPPANDTISGASVHGSGLLMRISSAKGSVMLAAAADRSALESVLRSTQVIASTVLQFPRSAPALALLSPAIDRIRPRVVLVSGTAATYSEESDSQGLESLKNTGTEILSPSTQGAVTITVRGREATVSIYRSRSY